MTLHLTYADRAEQHADVDTLLAAERITDHNPDALLAVYDDGDYDLILKSPSHDVVQRGVPRRDVAFEKYDLQLEWEEGGEFFDMTQSFFALTREQARVIARGLMKDLTINVDAYLTDEEGEEVVL